MKVEDDNDDKIYTISELISLLWVNYRYYLDNDIDYSLYNDRTCISISLFFSYLYCAWCDIIWIISFFAVTFILHQFMKM